MRITSRSRAVATVALVTAAVAAPPASAAGAEDFVLRGDGFAAASNGLELSSELIPDVDGLDRVFVGIRGRITAISPGRIARRCRRTRDGHLINISIAGEKYRSRFRIPSTGQFNLQIELEYGGIDEEGSFNDGDVPLSGGRVTFTVTVNPSEVPRGISPTDLKIYKCKKLKATTVVEVPPSR